MPRDPPFPSSQRNPSTVGRETLAELVEELEVSVGVRAPTEAEWLRRVCSIVWQNADRTWVVNARGDVWEITNRLRRTPPLRPLVVSDHLLSAPTLRLPLVPRIPPAQSIPASALQTASEAAHVA